MANFPPLKKIVVVFGSGRSGTSLLTQLLATMGLSISENLLGGHVENPDGFFEDIDLLELNKNIIAELGFSPFLPFPADWLEHNAATQFVKPARDLLEKKVTASKNTLVVKDPRFSVLLPFWAKIFKLLNIFPIYILSVRHPSATANSLVKQAPNAIFPALAELIWLSRTCDALWHVSGNCFIAHYEEILEQTEQFCTAIAHYLEDFGIEDITAHGLSDSKVVKERLNRSSALRNEAVNPLVSVLYSQLLKSRHGDFDKKALMSKVSECRRAMEGFKGWYLAAQQAQKKLGDSEIRLADLKSEVAKMRKDQFAMQQQLKAVQKENQRLEVMVAEVDKLSGALAGLSEYP
ncbi:sulfotransferase family protein [Allochromatium vinosum]|uniref:Sulfotransferase family protein n=1 Tax=Allochromatium vinosum (strain ATCC 17899 / DSM 180 / NBRC 103801 / NCIMB 10441 / D) TaxID=572477 RepID=D3RMD3_ALLVD|nr:sulfotransferase family protein [Allochromatium vinosum]ADC61191.1 conserved hypothetical protein [Allochromatium vinosum DSM 180]